MVQQIQPRGVIGAPFFAFSKDVYLESATSISSEVLLVYNV